MFRFKEVFLSQKDRILVYSDDPKDKALMDGSLQKKVHAEAQNQIVLKNNFVAVFRIEKNGRGGKIVTILDKLPAHESFVEQLTKEFKTKCGVGGSYSVNSECGSIIIQGDKREAMKKILESKQIKFRGV